MGRASLWDQKGGPCKYYSAPFLVSFYDSSELSLSFLPPCRPVINVHRGVTVPAGDTVCQMNVIPRVAFTFNATPSEALQEPVGANPIHSCWNISLAMLEASAPQEHLRFHAIKVFDWEMCFLARAYHHSPSSWKEREPGSAQQHLNLRFHQLLSFISPIG